MKNLINHIAVGFLISFLLGCSNGNNKAPIDSKQNKAGLLNEFIIMAYSGPPLEEVTLERYQEIEEAGIEYLVPGNGTFNEEQNLKAMDLAEKTGFSIVPIDLRILPFALKPDIAVDTAVIHQVVESYKGHPAFAGYVVRDEPNASCEEAASFSLSLSPGWKTDKLFTSIAANPAGNVNSLMEWYLEPGGAAIIDLIKTK
ncbi:MAG: hypothetical protein DRI98_02375 [Bacteroidetes bacterium]|nr:MAG: hypothetical protein DRI98_02375 [Bacteroidota bacterium]